MSQSVAGPEARPNVLLGAAVGVGMLVPLTCLVAWKVLEHYQQHDAAGILVLSLGLWSVAAPALVALAAMPRMLALREEILRLRQGDSAEPDAAPDLGRR